MRAIVLSVVLAALTCLPHPVRAIPAETLRSVVSVLPVWPGKAQGGQGAPPGVAPEGTGIAISPGNLIATAWHVVEPALRIDVRLWDGRIVPARLIGHDMASDIALLGIDESLPPLAIAPQPELAQPVCGIGNQYGLGLSVTCGVVSALRINNAGFNPVEDFVQTDAAVNPGSSGGALVDMEGRLVGQLNAIFAGFNDTNAGVNFAISAPLLIRVTDALKTDGKVDYVEPGWEVIPADRQQRARRPAALIAGIKPGGLADKAGVQPGDLVLAIDDWRVTGPRDVTSALALMTPDRVAEVTLERDGRELTLLLRPSPQTLPADPDCPHPAPVCAARQAVFPVSSFDPLASSVRIGPELLVTNRHVIGDWQKATIITPTGPVEAEVVPSSYRGDLALLKAIGLPPDGRTLEPDTGALEDGPYFTIGADPSRREVRVFEPGSLILPPAAEAELGRVHVTAPMQPGVSGGALVTAEGRLVGIAVGGGDGRYEAIPSSQVGQLLAGADDPTAKEAQAEIGTAYIACETALDESGRSRPGQPLPDPLETRLVEDCVRSGNLGQLIEAGRNLALSGAFEAGADLHAAATRQSPNSINARLSLLVTLQLGGRFEEMLPHARWIIDAAPSNPQALRFAIQAGIWGDDRELAETAYALLLKADSQQAAAARNFIDNPPPAPPRR